MAARMTAARVHDHLAALIETGRFAPGDRLPAERTVADELGAPRSAVRDALMMLENGGRIRRVRGSGTYVAPRNGPPGGASWTPRLASPAEIMEARLAFEPQLARLAAMHATPQEVCAMEEIGARTIENLEGPGFERLDAALHALIAGSTRNRLLDHLYAQITAARDQTLWGELKRRSATPANRAVYAAEHAALVAAIANRDAEGAEVAARQHLRSVRRHMLGE